MKKGKASLIKKYILDSLDNGIFKSNERLPGVKRIAAELNVSHTIVQGVLDSLIAEGILSTVPRGGSYVQENWRNCILTTNITVFQTERPWHSHLQSLLDTHLPELRLAKQFRESIFEIQTTSTVQAHHDEYLDLKPLFEECFPDKSNIELKPFESFYFDGKLAGIPIMYSPRVMFYNPAILEEANCPLPSPNWEWSDFLECIKILREKIEPERIFFWTDEPYYWISIIARCGGCLINPKLADPVRIDCAETLRGLELFRELGQLVNHRRHNNQDGSPRTGDIAFCIGGRDYLPIYEQKNWRPLPLPHIPGGINTTMQVTDLICVRKNCTNINTAKELIKLLLSEDYQNYLADLKYGIPILKSAARRSFEKASQDDQVFLAEAEFVKREYNLNSPFLYDLIMRGIKICLNSDGDMAPGLKQLADVVRTYLAIQDNSWNINSHQRREINAT